MAETETGWTKEFPSLRYGSWFWLRDAANKEPRLYQITGGRSWMEAFGVVSNTTEFLGPVTPSDFEQLVRLREAATKALQWMDWWIDRLPGRVSAPGSRMRNV